MKPTTDKQFSATANGNPIEYVECLIDLTYEYKDEKKKEGVTVVSEAYSPYIEWVPLDHKVFRWAKFAADQSAPPEESLVQGQVQKDEAPSFPVSMMKMTKTYHRVATVNPAWQAEMGKCNKTTVTLSSISLSCQPETLTLLKVDPKRDIQSTGDGTGWSVALELRWKAVGWNVYYRPDAQEWQRLMTKQFIAPTNQWSRNWYYQHQPSDTFVSTLFPV
jgi:hypothetical protein